MKKKTKKHIIGLHGAIVQLTKKGDICVECGKPVKQEMARKKKTQWNKIFKLGDKINNKLHLTEKDSIRMVSTYRKSKQIEKEGLKSLKLGMLELLSHGKRILNTRWFSVWVVKK